MAHVGLGIEAVARPLAVKRCLARALARWQRHSGNDHEAGDDEKLAQHVRFVPSHGRGSNARRRPPKRRAAAGRRPPPVSYTHLDVYKRQVEIRDAHEDGVGGTGGAGGDGQGGGAYVEFGSLTFLSLIHI